MRDREAGEQRNAVIEQRALRFAAETVNHGHENHKADIEENRNADDEAGEAERPLRFLFAESRRAIPARVTMIGWSGGMRDSLRCGW